MTRFFQEVTVFNPDDTVKRKCFVERTSQKWLTRIGKAHESGYHYLMHNSENCDIAYLILAFDRDNGETVIQDFTIREIPVGMTAKEYFSPVSDSVVMGYPVNVYEINDDINW